MSMKMTRSAYKQLIAEDLAWLDTLPRTLERDHVRLIVEHSEKNEYGPERIHASWESASVKELLEVIRWQSGVEKALNEQLDALREVLANTRHYDDRDMLRDALDAALENGMFRRDSDRTELTVYIAVPTFISNEDMRKALTCKVRLDRTYTEKHEQRNFFHWTYFEDGPLLTDEELALDVHEEGRKRLWVKGEKCCVPRTDWTLTPYKDQT